MQIDITTKNKFGNRVDNKRDTNVFTNHIKWFDKTEH